MEIIDTRPHALANLDIQVSFDELCEKIQTGTKRSDILTAAENTLNVVENFPVGFGKYWG
jgi:hypothetical protein